LTGFGWRVRACLREQKFFFAKKCEKGFAHKSHLNLGFDKLNFFIFEKVSP